MVVVLVVAVVVEAAGFLEVVVSLGEAECLVVVTREVTVVAAAAVIHVHNRPDVRRPDRVHLRRGHRREFSHRLAASAAVELHRVLAADRSQSEVLGELQVDEAVVPPPGVREERG